jgi:HAD superfamily hydrolase (TIGR01509 family)
MPGSPFRLPIEAVIFDMDGVLADTEPLHVHAWQRVLGGIDPAAVYEERGRLMGMSSPVIAAELIREFRLAISADELFRRKRDAFRDLAGKGLRAFRGLAEEMALLRHLPIGLATSSTREEADFMLERIGFRRMFSTVVTCDDVPAAKPAPDCYLMAARLLERSPSACCVIEDSINGMCSATAAGTRVLAVSPSPLAELPAGVIAVFKSTVEALQWLRN